MAKIAPLPWESGEYAERDCHLLSSRVKDETFLSVSYLTLPDSSRPILAGLFDPHAVSESDTMETREISKSLTNGCPKRSDATRVLPPLGPLVCRRYRSGGAVRNLRSGPRTDDAPVYSRQLSYLPRCRKR